MNILYLFILSGLAQMATVKEQFAHVLKHGLARTNRFQVLIPLPRSLQQQSSNVDQDKASSFLNSDVIKLISSFASGGTEVTRGLDMMTEMTELPGKNITTTDIRYNGDFYKLPYSVVYEPQQFVFRASRDMHEKNIIDEWMNLIFDPRSHEISYMDDFAVDITINQLDEQDNIVYSVILHDAFPTICTALQLSNEDSDQYHRISVSFMYRRWGRLGEAEEESSGLVDALSQTPFGPIVTPVLSNPAVQKGLEVFESNTGIDLEGEAVNVYNQVNSIVENTTGTSINKSVSLIESIRAATENNDNITSDQQAKVIEIIDKTLSQLRS